MGKDITTSFCLGHPTHTTRAEDVICRVCGNLLANSVLMGMYQVHQLLGRGRSGSAYLSTHLQSGQPVVVKLFPADARSTGLWERSRREVRIVSGLQHTSILPIFNCVSWLPGPSQSAYLLTLCQYVPNTLTQLRMSNQQLTSDEQVVKLIARLVALLQQTGGALNAAHTYGIVHGALVPGNVLLDKKDHLWVADFGLARLSPPLSPYLAPELQAASIAYAHSSNRTAYWDAVTPASDQYALAILCYNLFVPLLRPGDYQHWLPVLHRAVDPDPNKRFPGIDVFVYELIKQMSIRQGSPAHDTLARADSARVSTLATTATTDPIDWHLLPTQPQRVVSPAHFGNVASAASLHPSLAKTEDWERIGNKLFTLRDYEAAVQAYKKALAADAKKVPIWLALGDAYFALKHYAEALMAYEGALALNVDDPTAWSSKGAALDSLGRYVEAADCYERAQQLEKTI